jgi:hypothetical protein
MHIFGPGEGPRRRGIILNLGTTVSVSLSELAPLAPSPTSECVPPPPPGTEEGATLACELKRGVANSDDWRESLAL